MAKSKFLKMLNKRVGAFKGMKKHVRINNRSLQHREHGILLRSKLDDRLQAKVNWSESDARPTINRLATTTVFKGNRSKGIGTKMFEQVIKRSKGKRLTGDIINPHQIDIRDKFEGSYFVPFSRVKANAKRAKLELGDGALDVLGVTDIPKRGFKRHGIKKIGDKRKIRFIRKGNKVIPIRSK